MNLKQKKPNSSLRSPRLCESSSSLRSESGHAMLEMAISLIFLFNLTAGIIDFGCVLNNYPTIVEAAHQGALLASTNNHLQTNTNQKFSNCINKRTNSGSKTSYQEEKEHQKIDERVQQILNVPESMLVKDSLCVTSSVEDSSTKNSNDKNVVVTVEIAYNTLFYGSIPIRAQARAPFLQ